MNVGRDSTPKDQAITNNCKYVHGRVVIRSTAISEPRDYEPKHCIDRNIMFNELPLFTQISKFR